MNIYKYIYKHICIIYQNTFRDKGMEISKIVTENCRSDCLMTRSTLSRDLSSRSKYNRTDVIIYLYFIYNEIMLQITKSVHRSLAQ